MATRSLRQSRRQHRVAHSPLQHRLVQVMPPYTPGRRVDVGPGRGEDPLPRPLARRVRVLPVQGIWQLNPAGARGDVARMLRANTLEQAKAEVQRLQAKRDELAAAQEADAKARAAAEKARKMAALALAEK